MADDGDFMLIHKVHKFVFADLHMEALDGFQLVDRSSGMAEAASGHLRYRNIQSRYEWSQYKRRRVAYAPGGMLIDLDSPIADRSIVSPEFTIAIVKSARSRSDMS